MLQNFAAEITKKQPEKNWAGRFLKKHQDELV
jgi:hypothetical protein